MPSPCLAAGNIVGLPLIFARPILPTTRPRSIRGWLLAADFASLSTRCSSGVDLFFTLQMSTRTPAFAFDDRKSFHNAQFSTGRPALLRHFAFCQYGAENCRSTTYCESL